MKSTLCTTDYFFAARQVVFRTNSAKENIGRKSKLKEVEMLKLEN